MKRLLTALAATFVTAGAAHAAQSQPSASEARCELQIQAATGSTWVIRGYDPFGGSVPGAVYQLIFSNRGDGECRFTPVFSLDSPPFGLSSGRGRRIGYTIRDNFAGVDVTPFAGRSRRTPTQRQVVIPANGQQVVSYAFAVSEDDIRTDGLFTQVVFVEAEDQDGDLLGGTQLTLGVEVLPSARIGLAGAFVMNGGLASIDLGELEEGTVATPLQLRVNSTGKYTLTISSANRGRLRLDGSEWYVPYSMALGSEDVNLQSSATLQGIGTGDVNSVGLPFQFTIGDTSARRAGTYSDVISISVAPR